MNGSNVSYQPSFTRLADGKLTAVLTLVYFLHCVLKTSLESQITPEYHLFKVVESRNFCISSYTRFLNKNQLYVCPPDSSVGRTLDCQSGGKWLVRHRVLQVFTTMVVT